MPLTWIKDSQMKWNMLKFRTRSKGLAKIDNQRNDGKKLWKNKIIKGNL